MKQFYIKGLLMVILTTAILSYFVYAGKTGKITDQETALCCFATVASFILGIGVLKKNY